MTPPASVALTRGQDVLSLQSWPHCHAHLHVSFLWPLWDRVALMGLSVLLLIDQPPASSQTKQQLKRASSFISLACVMSSQLLAPLSIHGAQCCWTCLIVVLYHSFRYDAASKEFVHVVTIKSVLKHFAEPRHSLNCNCSWGTDHLSQWDASHRQFDPSWPYLPHYNKNKYLGVMIINGVTLVKIYFFCVSKNDTQPSKKDVAVSCHQQCQKQTEIKLKSHVSRGTNSTTANILCGCGIV